MHSGVDTCQPHGSVATSSSKNLLNAAGGFCGLGGSSFPLALWDMFGLVKLNDF